MSKAGPCGKGDEAAMRGWVAHCQQQENAERGIEAHHHRVTRIRLSWMQDAAYDGIDGGHKEESHQRQHHLQDPISTHGTSSKATLAQSVWSLKSRWACHSGTRSKMSG